MNERYFITATGTNVGKTLVTCALAWQARQAGYKVRAIKPVISGFDAADVAVSDTGQLLEAQGLSLDALHVEQCSPWRFKAALSPDMAAEEENAFIELEKLAKFCLAQEKPDELLLVEGAGGVMVPLNPFRTMTHLMQCLGYKVILVTGSYLGSISHTLTALSVLHHARLQVPRIIISESENGVPLPRLLATLRNFIEPSIELVTIPRLDYSAQLWKNAPNIVSGFV